MSWRLIFSMILAFGGGSALAESKCASALLSNTFNLEKIKRPPEKPMMLRESVLSEISYFERRKAEREKELETLKTDSLRQVVSDSIKIAEDMLKKAKQSLADMDNYEEVKIPDLKKEALAEIEPKLKANPELRRHFQDFLNYEFIRRFPTDDMVTVLIGSPRVEPTQEELEQGKVLISGLAKKGFVILLDGHSLATPKLLEFAGDRAVVLASRPIADLPDALVISNRYMLFDALRKSRTVLSTLTSTTGVAMSLFDQVKYFIGNKVGTVDALSRWQDNLRAKDRDMGLQLYVRISVLSDMHHELAYRWEFVKHNKPVGVEPRSLKREGLTALRSAASYANRMVINQPKTVGPKAVIFGSSQIRESSTPFVYQVAYQLGRFGLGVATGGSGGAMLAANMGAFDAGGESLGIPMTGKISSESKVYTEYHTNTVDAEGYPERVPWLLNGRKMIVNAPGGSGTMREVVLAMMSISQEENPEQLLIFLQDDYYGMLVSWLASLPIDPEIKARMGVVNSTDEFGKFVVAQAEAGRIDPKLYAKVQKPRNERTALPETLYKKSASTAGVVDIDWNAWGGMD